MIEYLLVYYSFLLILVFIGAGIFLIVRRKVNLTFFEALLLIFLNGYIVTITSFSLYQTGFTSINFLYIVLFMFGWFELTKMPPVTPKRPLVNWGHVLVLFIVSLFCFSLCYFTISNTSGYFQFEYSHRDYILYAKVSKYLSLTGQENGFFNLNELDTYYNGPDPYHYFDLWGASVASHFFGINHYLSLRLVVYPLFYFLCFVAVSCVFKKPDFFKLILGFISLWLGGIYFDFFQSNAFLNNLTSLSYNLFHPSPYKLSYFYLYFLCSYLLFSKGHTSLSIICLLGLTVANIITGPAIFLALLLVAAVLIYDKQMNRKDTYRTIAIIFLTATLFIVFYGVLRTDRAGMAGAEISSPAKLLEDTFSLASLKTQLNIIGGTSMFLIILYFPMALLLVHRRSISRLISDLWKPLPLFVLSCVLFSILLWTLLYAEVNSSQVFYNVSIPMINVTFSLLFLRTYADRGKFDSTLPNIVVAIFILFVIANNVQHSFSHIVNEKHQPHSAEYLENVEAAVDHGSLVASLKAPSEMTNMYFKHNVAYPLGDYFVLFDKNINSINVGDLDTPIDSTSKMNYVRSIKAVRNGFYYRFANFPENKDLTRDELLAKFLDTFDIKYLIVSKEAETPQFLKEKAKETFIDSKSGEQFLVF